MAGPAAILREIHRLRRFARDTQAELERIPRLVKGQQVKIARQEEELRAHHDTLKHFKVTNLEKEGQIKATVQQIAKYEKQLNEAASTKEYAALQAEIATARKKIQTLEEEVLGGMLEVEERTAQTPALEQALDQARTGEATFAREAETRRAHLTELLEQTHRQIQEVEATLPEDARPVYQRLLAARGEDALAAVQGRSCTACYTEITAQNANDLLRDQLVVCKSCGRILYLAEGPRSGAD